ncbi:MAG: methyltransferase family protein [Bosea sp. (in: a-proteobacteria)]|jgi:protein-S-isoprenylcysteine O-methyltransferase Ste14
MTRYHDRPNVIPWPPILFLGALALANVLSRTLPLAFPGPALLLEPVGWFVVAASLGLMLWAFLAFRQHQTSVLPNRRSEALITAAPFNLSRNPIYLSEAVLLFGLALANASLWYALVIAPFMLAVTRLAIIREEAHLAARFGREWAAYTARVRRWL